jgi:hypothetical protein
MFDFVHLRFLEFLFVKERDMVVSGGVTWWKDFICVACYNIIGHRDEV